MFIDSIKSNPRKVFVIDSVGALVSALLLSSILVPLKDYVGIPSGSLYTLSLIAFCLFIYSFCCYKFALARPRPFLAILVGLNSLYCLISIGFIVKSYDTLTTLGKAYFFPEISIIALLIWVEWQAYRHLSLEKSTKP